METWPIVDDDRGNPLISPTRSRIPFASESFYDSMYSRDLRVTVESNGKCKKFRFEEGRWGVDSMMFFGKKSKGRE